MIRQSRWGILAYEQAVPQTEAAKRHYAGGSCRGGVQTRLRSAFTVCEVDPSLAVRTAIAQLMTAILSQRACGTRAGLKPAPTIFATAMCFPSGVCGTLVTCDCPGHDRVFIQRAQIRFDPDSGTYLFIHMGGLARPAPSYSP